MMENFLTRYSQHARPTSHPVQDVVDEKSGLTSVFAWLMLGLLLVIPVIAIPYFPSYVMASKLLVFQGAAIIALGLYVFRSLRQRMVSLTSHYLALPLVIFVVSVATSTFLSTEYPVEQLMGWGGIYLSMVVLALIGGSLMPKNSYQKFTSVMAVSSIVVSLLTLTQIFGVGPSRLYTLLTQIELPHDALFNLAGSTFFAVQYLVVAAAALAWPIIKKRSATGLESLALLMSVFTIAVGAFYLLPGKPASPLLLHYGAGWSIALDVIRNPRAALIGIGPENFVSAYNAFRPVWTNGQVWWNTPFFQSSNAPLTFLVTGGFFGLLSWLYLAFASVRTARESKAEYGPLVATLLATLVLQLLFPNNIILVVLLTVALAVYMAAERDEESLVSIQLMKVNKSASHRQNVSLAASLTPLAIAVVVAGTGLYFLGRAYAAGAAFYQASLALAKNDAVKTYELHQQAVVLNPYLSGYRNSYALTNLAIASALSNKTDLTEADRAQISQLIQQAIREGRAATILRPDLSSNWLTLAQIYRNLIGTAEGADQWAVTSYVTAIEAAPLDPQLRLELGGVFYQQKQYQQAATFFQQAIELKPDFVSAYYSLANTLKQLNQFEAAQAAYQRTLALLDPSSEDYIVATKELEELQKAMQEAGGQQGKGTTTGQTGRTPALTPSPSPVVQGVPPITQQNINNAQTDVVNDPSAEDLQVAPSPTPLVSPVPSPTPAP